MKTRLVITDLTRMNGGRVCIAGYDEQNRCIRPVLPPPGIPETVLLDKNKPVIYPFASIEINLLRSAPRPPHTEDIFFVIQSIRHLQLIQDRRSILQKSLFESVQNIFEQPILTDLGFYVLDCQGVRSLGTVKPKEILNVRYAIGHEGTYDYRLMFTDSTSSEYRLKITDLTWQYYCRFLRGDDRDPDKISELLTAKLKSTEVFLRIGLARGWQLYPERCYLQITGIYTFPDYLEGKIFVEFLDSSR